VSLPVASVGAPLEASDDGLPADRLPVRPLRVLVAEDHAVNRAYLEAVLDKLGHRGVFVSDGHGAVLAVQTQAADAPFDVVLMDLHMPDMDGFTAARAIRALPDPQGRVPIVALTADAFQTSRELAREAGMDGFLTKPAHLPQLRDALQRHGAGTAPFAAAEAALDAAASTAETPAALLDLPTIQDVSQALTPAKYGELLGRFFDDRTAAVAALRKAVIDASHADLRSRAHSLKGAAASLGLRGVSSVAQQLQASTPRTSTVDLLQLLDQLDTQFELSLDACVRNGLVSGVTPPAVRAPA
jgi:CheY-like chemotaxis protein/HPt (histidine-containing phosphotransfer) domain-containing protein